ncbi:MAG: hypothetical protein JJU28_08660 [Cyclobacteriaceae bacterium]|nr:hypothetical protein [Cyclobacteriaceae bacterium]
MRSFVLLIYYSIGLFAVSYILLDIESMVMAELNNQVEIEIPENVLLDTLERMKYWNKFSGLFTFLLLTLKCFLMSLVLYAGLFFANKHQRARLGKLFDVAVYAESAIVLGGMVKVIYGSASDLTYSEFSLLAPLSVLSLFKVEAVQPLWYYPLQLLNVFELIYCFLLIFFFSRQLEMDKSESTKIVMGTYFFTTSFWLILILFLTLNFS